MNVAAPLSISVVIPVYNSEHSLAEVISRIQPVLKAHASAFEVVLVNDASRDESWAVVRKLSEEYRWVRGLSLMRNYGQHNALLCGIREARYELIVTMDDDLQNPPEEIPAMLERASEGWDVVYGVPQRERHGLFRDAASQLTKLILQKAMGAEVAKNVGAFRVFRTQLRKGFERFDGPLVNIDVLLTWSTTRFSSLRVRHDSRRRGVSNYTFRMLVVHAMNMVTGFSTLPLQVASFIGFGCTLFGLALLASVLVRYWIYGAVVPGFAFMASCMALFSGAQLFGLGVIGEYLARIHLKVLNRPSYIVRATAEPGGGGDHGPHYLQRTVSAEAPASREMVR
jgi:glycosyltransferase involved in cell wall biosynthesis